MKRAIAALLPVVIACAAACSSRHDTNRNLPPRTDEAENTKNNLKPYDTPNPGTGSGHEMAATPEVGSSAGEAEDAKDTRITENVRRAIMDDKTLSSAAKNIDVDTDDGVVTLRGPVPTERERKLLTDKASQVAGVVRVENKTDVKPKRT